MVFKISNWNCTYYLSGTAFSIVLVSGIIPMRFVIWFMIFTCVWFYYMMRINFSIIILAMVEPQKNANDTVVTPECIRENQNSLNGSLSSVEDYGVPDVSLSVIYKSTLT